MKKKEKKRRDKGDKEFDSDRVDTDQLVLFTCVLESVGVDVLFPLRFSIPSRPLSFANAFPG